MERHRFAGPQKPAEMCIKWTWNFRILLQIWLLIEAPQRDRELCSIPCHRQLQRIGLRNLVTHGDRNSRVQEPFVLEAHAAEVLLHLRETSNRHRCNLSKLCFSELHMHWLSIYTVGMTGISLHIFVDYINCIYLYTSLTIHDDEQTPIEMCN